MERHYGRYPGERGTHFVTGDTLLEVVHTEFWDNNRAQYRHLDGPHAGEEFDSTAEHFTPTRTETNPFAAAEFAPDNRQAFTTAEEAYRSLPDDVKWSCSFGYPGDGGFRDHYRTPDGTRYIVGNGAWDSFEPRTWTVEKVGG